MLESNLTFPSAALDNSYGKCLVATKDLPQGVVVERFAGPIVSYEDVPPAEISYACLIDNDKWLIPQTNARYMNHSCDPNCRIADNLEVITIRQVSKGEDLTFSYNTVTTHEMVNMSESLFWDSRWSFNCLCGAHNCTGRVDGYIVKEEGLVGLFQKVAVKIINGKGRAVIALEDIKKGALIEKASVIVSDKSEWEELKKTIIYNYCFSWGKELEHAAIALGYGSLYNHSFQPNAYYTRHVEQLVIDFVAYKDIVAGEEITINYNHDPLCQDELWFKPKKTGDNK